MAQLSFLTYLRGIYKLNLTKSGKVHNAVIQSIYDCFIMAQEDLDLMRLEMCLSTATGYWLDSWGDFFSVYRKSNESDGNYSKRIIDSVIQPKSTIPAVKDNIVDFLNSEYHKNYTREDISIKEPWKEIAKYSHKGSLSNDARFFSGNYYCHAVMDISVPEEVTKELIDLVSSVKAAGVKVIWSILNSYDIVSGFNDANDAWAAYHRHIQTQTQRNQFSGLILSNSSPSPVLSGRREVWYMVTSLYQWYAKVLDKKTDESIIITKKDLIGLLDYYTEYEEKISTNIELALDISNKGKMSSEKRISGNKTTVEVVESLVKITDELLESLELLDTFLSLSFSGRMSTSDGVMFEHLAEHTLFEKFIDEIARFKEKNEEYYNSVQPPILNGERAMWLVERNKNWLWNTPTMTHEDFFELWEPFDDYKTYKNSVDLDGNKYSIELNDQKYTIITSDGTELKEHTINSIIDFEDAYYKGYITFGDKYQPPVVVGRKLYGTPRTLKDWLFSSPVYCNFEMEEVYRRQFAYILGKADNPNPTMEEIMLLEEKYNYEGYSIATVTQPAIEVKSEYAPINPYDVVVGFNRSNKYKTQYSRSIETSTEKEKISGLYLSDGDIVSSVLSGKQTIWSNGSSDFYYQTSVTIGNRETDQSMTVTKKDLIGLLDFYTEYGETLYISDNGNLSTNKTLSTLGTTAEQVKVTDDILECINLVDTFVTLSDQGKMSTSSGVIFNSSKEYNLFRKLLREVNKFKDEQEQYYNSVQAPILTVESL